MAIIVFQVIPGAGTIAILNATARGGVSLAYGAVCGMLTGDLIMMVAAMAGLAAVMNAYPVLFIALQWFGVAYLCWFGLQLLLRKVSGATEPVSIPTNRWTYFRQAMFVSVSNPKVMLFFVAFFPLFLTPHASLFTLAVMMAHITVTSFIYQSILVLAGNAVAQKLKNLPQVKTLVTRGAGLALIGFGVKLATGAGR